MARAATRPKSQWNNLNDGPQRLSGNLKPLSSTQMKNTSRKQRTEHREQQLTRKEQKRVDKNREILGQTGSKGKKDQTDPRELFSRPSHHLRSCLSMDSNPKFDSIDVGNAQVLRINYDWFRRYVPLVE